MLMPFEHRLSRFGFGSSGQIVKIVMARMTRGVLCGLHAIAFLDVCMCVEM